MSKSTDEFKKIVKNEPSGFDRLAKRKISIKKLPSKPTVSRIIRNETKIREEINIQKFKVIKS